jgi:hypothetical protein
VHIDLPQPLAVVLHDAGSANLAVAWLKHYRGSMLAVALGPAADIWSKAFPYVRTLPLEDALVPAAALLSGTSWASDVEHRARKLARESAKHAIAVVDHWVNYRARFTRAEELVLPDEIWVGDEDAVREARQCFPGLPVRQLPNLYLDGLVREVSSHDPVPAREIPRHVLYVLEPIRQGWGSDERPGELQAFEFFLDSLPRLGVPAGVQIRLRPHPSDPPGKYEPWLRRFAAMNLLVDGSSSLASQIAWADWVVGCESFALVIALRANRIVLSTLPPWAPECRLPQRELRHVRELVRSSQ